ncbi:MAG: DUF3570 domain-containing protein [Myxococcota bacterium]
MRDSLRLLATLLLCVTAVSAARADRASGTWTGEFQLRGSYYWERSTRVVAPSSSVQLESPNGVRLGGEYLIDSITSASQAAGVLEDVRFTEIRHQGSVNVGREWDLGDAHLDLSANARVSREPDYLSVGGGVAAQLSLADRTTILRTSFNYLHDEVRQRFQTGGGSRPNMDGSIGSTFNENFEALALSVGWEQILSPVVYFQLTYQYGYMDGFLANAYRRVVVNDALRPESHPEVRRRHTLTGRLAFHLRATRTSVHLIYRSYYDNWRVGALTPEVRIYQRISRHALMRARWRHYRQTRAFFYEDVYPMDTPDDAFVTADPKMSRFHSNLLGFQILLRGSFLDGTPLEALRDLTFDLSFDYIWNTNRFGNGVIAEAGLRLPFG